MKPLYPNLAFPNCDVLHKRIHANLVYREFRLISKF